MLRAGVWPFWLIESGHRRGRDGKMLVVQTANGERGTNELDGLLFFSKAVQVDKPPVLFTGSFRHVSVDVFFLDFILFFLNGAQIGVETIPL